VRKIKFGLKGARNYFWYRARVNLSTALVMTSLKWSHDWFFKSSISP